MNPLPNTVFDLPAHLTDKDDPALIGADEHHFAAIAETLDHTITELTAQADALRRLPAVAGQQALERDLEIHRLSNRLRVFRRFGLDLCLGHFVPEHDQEPVYVGRFGLADTEGRQLMVDWRSRAAEPFFAATHAQPMGLLSRRRYRWSQGRVTDYWDEIFTAEGARSRVALDDQSAFIASLGADRSETMRDVLGTIQADQDAIIRASSHGALVVDGGPGTGKTVVALHRAAYLLYADPRLREGRGGVLFIGPHKPYLAYVADVLPSLGEDGVQTCTVRDLVAEGATAPAEPDPEVTRLKSTAAMVGAIEPAVALYEEPPTRGMEVSTEWGDVWLSAEEWAEAFRAPDPGTPHNEARDQVWEELVDIIFDKFDPDDEDLTEELLRRELVRDTELTTTLTRAWPILEPTDLVGDLWEVQAYLRRCAPWLDDAEVRTLQRADPQAWTEADLPLLDAARHRLGDPEFARRQRRREAVEAAERDRMSVVVEDLLSADLDHDGMVQALRQSKIRDALVDDAALPVPDPDALAGPFAHVIVDEAQELTDAQWQMLISRCPARSFTIVGDRAQARHGFTESWTERLQRIGLERIEQASLSTNYRTPIEVMTEAEKVIRTVLPDANVPTSIRSTGVPVRHGAVADLTTLVDAWLATHRDGIACVITTGDIEDQLPDSPRIRALSPELTKGLEFDLVVLINPSSYGDGIEGAVDRYVAMTRATSELIILTDDRS
ncbi:RNA polymerase recycling motor ATPase HelR [Propionibacteriaceae bacterium Y1700]|uniref:RNA polymerase recycling motor ATPase HelR n=1 Tax=Microlunatus sp. Y1700 TaxID=3418487 RepID=UPI003DA744D4